MGWGLGKRDIPFDFAGGGSVFLDSTAGFGRGTRRGGEKKKKKGEFFF